jgi:hypothetical protein
LAASAFALDLGNGLTVGGTVKAGVDVNYANDGVDDNDDATIKLWNNDAGQVFRGDLTFGYAADWGGAKVMWRTDSIDSKDFTVQYGYGWTNLLGGKVEIAAGDIDGDKWGLGKIFNAFDPSFDAVKGVRIDVKPFESLNFGVALRLEKESSLGDAFGSTVIGAVYKSTSVSGVFGLQLNPETDAVPAAQTPAYDSWVDLYAGVEIAPFTGLKIALDGRFDTRKYMDDNKQLNDKNGYALIGVKGEYVINAITAFLKSEIAIQNDGYGDSTRDQRKVADFPTPADKKKYTEDAHAKWVEVEALGDTSIQFELGGDYKVSDTLNTYIRIGSDNVKWFEVNGLYVKPGVKFTLGSSSIEIFDKLNKIGAKEIAEAGSVKAHSPFSNQFQIDFNWSF